ncbi:PPW family C-terminal domain-containing PPE protein, partial [Mycobacterium tuberculosis]
TAPASAPAAGAAPGPPAGTATATSASVPTSAGGFPPYLVGSGPGIDFDAGTPAGSRRAQPAADNVTAVAAAQVSARHQARRCRRAAAKERGNADEFVDMDSGPAIPPSGERDAWASNSGVGGLGFAGTASNETVAAPAGLTTLADDEFQCGPRMPMLPGAWDLGTWDRGD